MTNQEIRRKILELLYNEYQIHPYLTVSAKDLLYKIGITKQELFTNIVYLEEKGYVELQKALGTPFISARISVYGIELVEDESEFNIKFRIRQNITHIEGDMIGVVSQGDNAQITTQIKI